MSYTTRCGACGTVFRVVADQLKISDGWVRCGHCHEVFDANLELRSLDEPAPVPRGAIHLHAEAGAPESVAPDDGEVGEVPVEAEAPSDIESIEWSDEDEPSEPSVHADGEPPRDDRAEPSEPLTQAGAGMPVPAPMPTPKYFGAAPDTTEDDNEPGFVRKARGRARWRTPVARTVLWGAFVVLSLGLGVQALLQFHRPLTLWQPALQPVVRTACQWLGCNVQALRDIAALRLEGNALFRRASSRYVLEFTVRNGALAEVLTPALELTLTDLAGRAWLRRVITVQEMGADTPSTLAPRSTLPVRLELTIDELDGQPVSGYQALLFYP